jgi:hypothetical protein
MRELGEIDMMSKALAMLDLVTHDSGRVLRHDSKALVLCAGDRDLPALLAYLAALRLGHADRLSGPLVAIQHGDGTSPALFLVYPDNAQAGPYCRLAHALGEEFAVSGVHAAGLYSDAEPRRTAAAVADADQR